MNKFFGTDGVRGLANSGKIRPEVMMRLGMAAGKVSFNGDHQHRVIIGKDTRRSGYMLEHALASGLVSAGMDVLIAGPTPTPALGMLTKSLRADLGVMITASHNPFHDNGVKLFGADGYKISDTLERQIEALMTDDSIDLHARADRIGQVSALTDSNGRYIEAAKATFPSDMSLEGIKIVVDCANGAGYRTAPRALWELGADVVSMGVTPNGSNINLNCGSTHTGPLSERVVAEKAHIGLALDGDADRIIVVDEKGNVIDGDQILARIALTMKQTERLRGGGIVATVMSNLGLETFLDKEGLALHRTKVGDRYVVARMRAGGFNLGGEQSGHVVLRDHATTGDGLVAGLQVIAAMIRRGRPASECLNMFTPVPQRLINLRYDQVDPMDSPDVIAAIADTEVKLGKTGRLLIRKSGTEPIVRVMVEAEDEGLCNSSCEALARLVEDTIAKSA